jgi:biopolymer transport protein ExbD
MTRRDSGDGTFRPQLTSLVDVMTILLVFLLKSFSVEGNLITPAPDLELPLSTSQKPPRPTCTVEITRTAVVAEGNVLAACETFASSGSLLVPALFDWMSIQRRACADSVRVKDVLIQADRTVPFNIIKRVMFTCSKAGFSDFSVLVIGEE